MLLANDLDMLHLHQDCNEGLTECKKERSKSSSMCHLIGLSSASGIKNKLPESNKIILSVKKIGVTSMGQHCCLENNLIPQFIKKYVLIGEVF